MDDNKFERELVAKGLTAPRITPADIKATIASEHYFTAQAGVVGQEYYDHDRAAKAVELACGDTIPKALSLLTICVLVLQNGFTVLGKSACASPENFDAKIGREVARADAVSQCWPLLGYALKEELHRRAQIQPTYYVAHPDGTHSVADPQPVA